MRVLITGGCGFIGHHFVEHFIKATDWDIVVLDKLNYSGSFDRLRDISCMPHPRVQVFTHDLELPVPHNLIKELGKIDCIFHLAAETHVDRSISDPRPFVVSNVIGTMNILDVAKAIGAVFYYFSTDEVFGPAPDGVEFKEDDVLSPKNPYAASKAGGEMLVTAYANTYGLPCLITRCMNVFGERQHPEKFIPRIIRACMTGEKLLIHADCTRTRPGSRFWIHARNVADAYRWLVQSGMPDVYHIVGEREIDNLSMAQMIASEIGKELYFELVDFHSSRPGHDLRYAMADTKLRPGGWQCPVPFEDSLKRTVEWTLKSKQWLTLE